MSRMLAAMLLMMGLSTGSAPPAAGLQMPIGPPPRRPRPAPAPGAVVVDEPAGDEPELSPSERLGNIKLPDVRSSTNPLRVECPRCQAQRDQLCDRRTLGAQMFHRARIDAWLTWTADQ